jgi:flavin reductase (DIM6/NTAB) family NADH-FMN oxidoreductase RutF
VSDSPTLDDSASAELRAAFLGQMRLVPGAVAIVACADGEERGGLAVTAWNSLTADPPMLLACVNRSTGAYPLIERRGAFSLNVLPSEDTETVAIFSGQRGLRGNDRFTADDWHDGALSQPLLNSAIAAFECTVEAMHDHGTHSIIVGRITALHRGDETHALLYVDGSFTMAARRE